MLGPRVEYISKGKYAGRAWPLSAETCLTRARGPWFDTRSGHILLFLLPLIHEGQFSVTGEKVCRPPSLKPLKTYILHEIL